MRSPAAAAKAAAGGYFAQVTSQRSEADALASLRSLQEKFPSELGDRDAIKIGPARLVFRLLKKTGSTASTVDGRERP